MKEVRQKRSHIVGFYLCAISRKDKSIESEDRLVVTSGWRKGDGEKLLTGYRVLLGSNGNVLVTR